MISSSSSRCWKDSLPYLCAQIPLIISRSQVLLISERYSSYQLFCATLPSLAAFVCEGKGIGFALCKGFDNYSVTSSRRAKGSKSSMPLYTPQRYTSTASQANWYLASPLSFLAYTYILHASILRLKTFIHMIRCQDKRGNRLCLHFPWSSNI